MSQQTWYGPEIAPPKTEDHELRKVLAMHLLPNGSYEISTGYRLSDSQWILEGKLQPARAVRCWTFLPVMPVFEDADVAVPVDFHTARFTPPVPEASKKS